MARVPTSSRHRRPAPRTAPDSLERLRIGVRATAALLSVTLLLVSGWFWATYRNFEAGLTRSTALTVLGPHAQTSQHGDTNILLIGLDSRRNMDGSPLTASELGPLHAGDSDVGGYNTNTLILIHVPGNGTRATAISIPRDDYVAVPGYGMQKIKEAYGLAKAAADSQLYARGVKEPQREQLARDAGRRSTILTLQNLLKVPIDHFAEVNLVGFYDIVKAIGPVTVCLNQAVDDRAYSGADFPAGVQTLDAAQALAFVRQRHGLANGDLDRTHRQQAFIAAVTHKLRGDGVLGDLGKLQALLDVTKKDVVIDDRLDPLRFAATASDLTAGRVDFYTLPITGFATRNGQDVNLVDPAQLRREVAALFSDHPATTAPPAPTSAGAATPTAPAHRKAQTVDVLNGSNTAGLAATTSARLVAEGYRKGAVGSLPGRATTAVFYAPGSASAAAAIAAGYHAHATEDPELPTGHLRIELGADADPAVPTSGGQGPAVVARGGIPCVN
jgi:LCP family protein required for cell wall assembly